MGDVMGPLEDSARVGMDDEAYEQFLDDLRALHDLENTKAFLEEENGKLKSSLDSLAGELEGLNIAISSAEIEKLTMENRTKRCLSNIEILKEKTTGKASKLNELHLRIKLAVEDVDASANLAEALETKLADILREKNILIKRLNDMKAGLQTISEEKEDKLPHLKQYHSVLKQIHNTFQETRNRMDVSMILKNS